MFAYCRNNPVNLTDSTGQAPISSNFSYSHINDAGVKWAYINDQKDSSIGSLSFGIGNVGNNGCGAVASYNALKTLANFTTFEDVLSYYNNRISDMNLLGLAGMMPWTVADFFREQGCKVIVTDNTDKIDMYSRSADVCILWYLYTYEQSTLYGLVNFDMFGGHFIEYSRTSTGYIAHNTAAGGGVSYFTSPSDYGYQNSRFYAVGIFIYRS